MSTTVSASSTTLQVLSTSSTILPISRYLPVSLSQSPAVVPPRVAGKSLALVVVEALAILCVLDHSSPRPVQPRIHSVSALRATVAHS